ncbi:hypothetical protein B0T22DRAFT_491667 [Podospora appendiculata]|uniref:F-box domain-containing protein n=1 Tax=Podospora appendiculata TaxID=314037 RepID=A0AAE0XDH1_9PEZI|nr:hypothetical protein B0T22DRAFT_491667 [Podospora appendiculata]
MDKLSPEILSLILAYVFADAVPVLRRHGLATVSRKWQALVEQRAFSGITIWLNDKGLSGFADAFRSPRRRTLLRRLVVCFNLPTDGKSRRRQDKNNAALTTTLTSLYTYLSTWEPTGRTLDVSLFCDSRGNIPSRRNLTLTQATLPPVPCITSLNIRARKGRSLHPASICTLAAHLPNLQSLTLHVKTPTPSRPELRRTMRTALADGLSTLTLPSLRHLELIESPTPDIHAHSFPCANLCDPADGTDPLNTALRRFSQRTPLTSLTLTDIMISPDLFTGGSDATAPWPTLHVFAIEASALAPSGAWYWTGDPSASRASTPPEDDDDDDGGGGDDDYRYMFPPPLEDDPDDRNSEPESNFAADAVRNGYEPSDEWRDTPDDAALTPLLVAMARAAQRMPNLRAGSLYLEHELEFRAGCTEIAISCAAAGERFARSWDSEDDGVDGVKSGVRRCKVWVDAKYPWAVPEEVREAWREWLGETGMFETGYFRDLHDSESVTGYIWW